MSGQICWRIAQRDKRCWQPAVRGSQMDMSCLLLSLRGFVSSVCWQSPLGAQTFKSVFCHGLSSFCYTWVTTALLFPLCSSLCWLRASSSLSGYSLSFIHRLPHPSSWLGIPAFWKNQPKSCVRHLPIVLFLHSTFTHSLHCCWGTCGWTGGSDRERQRVWASSDFTGTPVWFSSLANSGMCVFNSPCSCCSWVLQALSVSQCLWGCHRAQPAFPECRGRCWRWHGVVSQLNRSTYLGTRVKWVSPSLHGLGTREGFLWSAWLCSHIPIPVCACAVLCRAAIVLGLERSLPWISCLPLQSVPCVGGIFLPNRGYGPSHVQCLGESITALLLAEVVWLPLAALLSVCLFRVFTDGLTPWSISHHCSALCLIRELNGRDRIKVFSW